MKKVAYIVIGLIIAGVLAAVFIPMIAKGPPYPGLETTVGMFIPLFLFLAGIYVLIRIVQFFIGMRRGYRKGNRQ